MSRAAAVGPSPPLVAIGGLAPRRLGPDGHRRRPRRVTGTDLPGRLRDRVDDARRARAVHQRRRAVHHSRHRRRPAQGHRAPSRIRAGRHDRSTSRAATPPASTSGLSLVTIQLPAGALAREVLRAPRRLRRADRRRARGPVRSGQGERRPQPTAVAVLSVRVRGGAEDHAARAGARGAVHRVRYGRPVERSRVALRPGQDARHARVSRAASSPENGRRSRCRSSPISPMSVSSSITASTSRGFDVVDGDSLIRIDFTPAPVVPRSGRRGHDLPRSEDVSAARHRHRRW